MTNSKATGQKPKQKVAKYAVLEADRKKVTTEITDLQIRIVKMLVPTILSLGLIATGGIGDEAKGSSNMIALKFYCLFGILFGSSLYVVCLSHKIFRNAGFLKTFTKKPQDGEPQIVWERALDKYRKATWHELIIGSETGAVSAIYMVLALVFYMAFKGIGQEPATIADGPVMIFLTIVLAAVAVLILAVYCFRVRLIDKKWQSVIGEIEGDAEKQYLSSR